MKIAVDTTVVEGVFSSLSTGVCVMSGILISATCNVIVGLVCGSGTDVI